MTNNVSMFRKLAILAISSLALLGNSVASADTINSKVFDWTDHAVGSYYYEYRGVYDDGNGAQGTAMRLVLTQTSQTFDSLPVNSFPAELTHLVYEMDYVVKKDGTPLIPISQTPITAKFWNDFGDSLLAVGYLKQPGTSYINEYLFTGGTGAYAGASGWRIVYGTTVSATQKIWSSVNHLELPSPVPEPESYAMMLAGLAVLAAMGRRHRRPCADVPMGSL